MKQKRNQEYYVTLVDKIGSDIKTTDQIYVLIQETDAEFGFNCPKNLLSQVMTRFCDLLGDTITSMDDTETKRRGRGNPKLYQVNVEAAKEIIRSSKVPQKKEKELKPVEGKPVGKILLDQKTLYTQLYQQLDVAYDAGSFVVTLTPTRMRLLDKYHAETMVYADWTQKHKNILRFRAQVDIKNSMISLDSYVKETFGIDLGACTKFNIVKVASREMRVSEVDEKFILYIVMKLIQKEKKSVDTTFILKVLREHFGFTMDRQSLVSIAKEEKQLSVSLDKQAIGVVSIDSLEKLIQAYSPENYKEVVFARLGMKPEEVLGYFPEAQLVSKISDNDGIYRLEVSRSFKSRAQLLKLYRTFRGTDMILGSEHIVDYLNIQVARADGLYNRDSMMYRLEAE